MFNRIVLFLCMAGAPVRTEAQIVIDHECTDATQIPDAWLAQVRTMRLQSIGESHSTQLTHGLRLLEAQDSRFSVEIEGSSENFNETDVLQVLSSQYWGVYADQVGYVGEEDYWATPTARDMTDTTLHYAENAGEPLDVSSWCWCTLDISRNTCYPEDFDYVESAMWEDAEDFTDERCRTYLAAVDTCNTRYPGTYSVYNTSVSDDWNTDRAARFNRYNDSIRVHFAGTGGILFDHADIENWNADNTEQQYYQAYLVRHAEYGEGTGDDTQSGDHTNDALCLRKANALWWMMARVAGWDGGTPVTLSSFTAEQQADSVVLAWATQSENANMGWNIYRQTDGQAGEVKMNASLIPGGGTVSVPRYYSFTDTEVPQDAVTLRYALEQVDSNGTPNRIASREVTLAVSGMDRDAAGRSNAAATVHASVVSRNGLRQLLAAGDMTLYDVSGRTFSANHYGGRAVPVGIYVLTGGRSIQTVTVIEGSGK